MGDKVMFLLNRCDKMMVQNEKKVAKMYIIKLGCGCFYIKMYKFVRITLCFYLSEWGFLS